MFCTKCGNQIKDGFKFCPKCGTPVYVEKEASQSEVKPEEVKKNTSQDITLNPLLLEELDIDDVKKKAEQGDKAAMLRQAFRYEMGIGGEKNLDKAEELYDKVGAKNVLFSLEDTYANCILPDPYYGLAVPQNKKANSGFYFKTLPFVKDLIFDYAIKVNSAKMDGKVAEEELKAYKEEFVKKLLVVRDRYPEYLFVNFDTDISKDKVTQLFDVIKQNSSKRYSLSWLPSLFYFSDYVDGNRIEIPNIYYLDFASDKKIMFVDDDSPNGFNPSRLLQIVYSILFQLPVKKVHFTFCCSSYEDVGVIFNNLDSSIYEIVCSEEDFEIFSKKVEIRKRDIIKKYGVYQDFCENNETIPIPYEFVINLDPDYFYDLKDTDIFESITFGKVTGVYYFEYVPYNEYAQHKYYKNLILNPQKNELYTDDPSFYGKYLIYNGLYYGTPYYKDPIPMPSMGQDGHLVYRHTIETEKDSDYLDFREGWETYDRIVEGEGEYEVALQIGLHPENIKLDFDESYDFEKNFGLNEQEYKCWIGYDNYFPTKCKTQFYGGRLVLKAFQTEKEALAYMNDKRNQNIKPEIIKSVSQRIRLVPYYTLDHLNILGIALYIPDYVNSKKEYQDDLLFYLTQIGISKSNSVKLIKYISVGYHGLVLKKVEKVSHLNMGCYTVKTEGISIIDENELGGKGFFFPNIINKKYNIETNIWGTQKNFSGVLSLCTNDIHEIENELNNHAKKEWGEDYAYNHLIFSDKPMDICRFEVRKVKHYKLPIMRYRPSNNDSIIKWTPISDNKKLLNACIDYINNEAHAKEEMKVQTLDFASAAENMYETDLSTMTIPVGKAEVKDSDFRMDLVSHVHSFIIGQSGSGKSVFLHNIIGGAMLKYAPEDLQLYLLDFKLGGVEFNRYQGAKHVKALLVDNSDPQVTLEILKELRNSMSERGKLLRGAGVNNIGEYNKMHQQDRMPHVLVVADECHEMFKADDSIPRQVRNEISDIVIKIAKEGRSQGVHLVFATQTLSGTEISSEIINNVSDFYLLKCAQTDSERLVPNSSTITSELSTGQIYYHHVDEQVKFQAYYTDREAAEKLMAAIVEKAKYNKSNGEFYFNGAQMFYLDESIKDQILNVKGKSPVAFLGKAIDISQKDLYIRLNEDFSENVLLLGLNDQEQVTRTTMNLFVSLMMSAKLKHKDIAFKVIDCLNNEEGEVHELIYDLENEGLCEIIERRQRSKFFKDLAQGVLDGTAEETILLILGQDRFRELKMDMELEDNNTSKSSDDDDMMSISDDFFGGGSSSSSSVKTYKGALNVILEKGPDYGVHTLLQIEKASNLLFEDYITPKVVFQKFKRLVMLKSDETAGVTLHLNDEIRLEKLSSDWERLRAYYYAEESDSYTLFTPYMPSKSKDIINMLKTK